MYTRQTEKQPFLALITNILLFMCFAYVLAVAVIAHVEMGKATGLFGNTVFVMGIVYSVQSCWNSIFTWYKKE